MFRASDVRRVKAYFDEAVEPPYDAVVEVSAPDRLTLTVAVADPDAPDKTVVRCAWSYDERLARRRVLQPEDREVSTVAARFASLCSQHRAGPSGDE